ncbi:MAG: sulfotransferase [Actinomycetota bacterium]
MFTATAKTHSKSPAAVLKKGTHLAGLYAWSLIEGFRRRDSFREVDSFVVFIGHQRSGHSLVGSLLNAHPEMVIAYELDVLGLVTRGFSRNQIFAMIVRRDRLFAEAGNIQGRTGYDFSVPGQWQGRARHFRVLGAKKGPRTTRRLFRDRQLLAEFKGKLGPKIKAIHVVRNPYDNIATMAARLDVSLAAASQEFFLLCEELREVRTMLTPGELYTIRHEGFVQDPARRLASLCEWLDVEPEAEYVRNSAGVVFESPRKTRGAADWTPDLVARVEREMGQFDFLAGYSFVS